MGQNMSQLYIYMHLLAPYLKLNIFQEQNYKYSETDADRQANCVES